MGEASAETFGGGSSEIVQRVIDAARIELRVEPHDFMGPAPSHVVCGEPRSFGLVQVERERIHDPSM
jgi:hypothetical protein